MIKLCKRLQELANLCDSCNTIADIGSDHGKLPCYLLQNNKANFAIVTDISKLSLNKAVNLLKENNLENKADFIVTNGFNNIDKNIDIAIVAGMGGMEIIKILKNIPKFIKTILLQPQTDAYFLRKYITEELSFCITKDKIISSGDKYYDIIKAKKTDKDNFLNEEELQLGKTNLKEKNNLFYNYLIKEKDKLKKITKQAQKSVNINYKAINRLNIIQNVLKHYTTENID